MSEDSATKAEAAEDLTPEAGALDEQIEEGTLKPHGRRKKMLIILGVAVVGGIILGISFTLLLSALKPTPQEQVKTSAPAPVRDPHQESLIRDLQARNQQLEAQAKQQSVVQTKPAEYSAPRDDNELIKELKAKNEKLEEQLRLSHQTAPSLPPPRSFAHGKPSNAKVTEDCTISDQTVPLGEKLKSCVEDFNRITR